MQSLSDSDSSFEEIDPQQNILTSSPLPSETTTQKLKNLLTNSVFILEGLTSKFTSIISQTNNPEYYLLGEKIKDKETAILKSSKTIWFTYRNNFPGLLNNTQISDTGWGCMIRVGQMFLAEMLRRFQEYNYEQINQSNILTAFLDDDESKGDSINYSIQKIVKIGNEQFKLKPGTWLTPSHISYIIEQIHNNRPLRGYENLKVIVFNNNTLFYQQVLNQMGYKLCACQNFKIRCFKCHKTPIEKTSLVLILLSRVGLDSPQEEYRRVVMQLLELRQSLGIIGGKPNKALYFIGRQGLDRLIYLDPHYVQLSTSRKNMQTLKQTFYCNSYRTIQYKSIDPSIGFGFYIQDIDDLADFYNNLLRINKTYRQDFFIYAQMKIPPYVAKELIEQKRELQKRRLKMSTIFNETQKTNDQAFQI